MIVERLELVDFRNYDQATFELTDGMTVVVGDNGQGKTNLAEALAYLATLESFRGAARRAGARRSGRRDRAGRGARRRRSRGRWSRPSWCPAVATASWSTGSGWPGPRPARRRAGHRVLARRPHAGEGRSGRPAPLPRRHARRPRRQVRRGPPRARPDRPPAQHAAEAGRRSARRGGGDDARRLGRPAWRRRGEQFGHARDVLVAAHRAPRRRGLRAPRRPAHDDRSCATTRRGGGRDWPPRSPRRAPTTCAAASRRSARTATSSTLAIDGLPARTHASQGEQRTLALALRLGAHRLVAERTGSSPVLVLDDVLSELDPDRAAALLGRLPPGQVVITTAGHGPSGGGPAATVAHQRRHESSNGPDEARRPGGGSEASMASGHDDPVPIGTALDRVVRAMRAGAGRREVGWACSAAGTRPSATPIAANVRPVRLDGPLAGRGRRAGVGHPAALPRRRAAGSVGRGDGRRDRGRDRRPGAASPAATSPSAR